MSPDVEHGGVESHRNERAEVEHGLDQRGVGAGPLRRIAGVVGFVLQQVLVEPVREGRLRDTGWAPGLKVIVVAGLALYAVVMGLAVFGGPLRSVTELIYRSPSDTFPAIALPGIVVAVVFACSCLFTAALHAVWWVRPLALLVVLAVVLKPLELSESHWTNFVFLAAAAALVLVMALRWSKPFVWWEFILVLAIIGHAVVANVVFRNQLYAGYATDLQLNSLSLIMLVLWSLALPAALVAGSAMAELTISTVAWTVTGVARAVSGRRAALVCLVLVLLGSLGRFARSVWELATDESHHPSSFLIGAAMTVVLAGLCLLVVRIGPSGSVRPESPDGTGQEGTGQECTGPGGEPPTTDSALGNWSRATLPLALLLAAGMVGTTLANQVLQVMGLGGLGRWVQDVGGADQVRFLGGVTGLVGIARGVWLARRGRHEPALVWSVFGGLMALMTLNSVVGVEASVPGILSAAAAIVLAVTGVLLVRGRWRLETALPLALVAVLGVVYEFREYIFEPVTAVFALTGVGAGLLVGLLWRLLTDNGYSRGDSVRFPRTSRVLLAIANATFGVTAVAMVSLSGGFWELDLERAEGTGDTILGGTLLIVTLFVALRSSLTQGARATRREQVPPDRVGLDDRN